MKKRYHEGIFYPADGDKLKTLISPIEKKEGARALIVPHQELTLSSPLLRAAASYFGSPSLIVILSPLHSGRMESDRDFSFFEGEENKSENLINLGAEIRECYAEEEPSAEILLPFIHEYCPGASVAVVYTDIRTAKESKELSSFLKKTEKNTLFIISSNLSGICSSVEEAERYGKRAMDALMNEENILDLTHRNIVKICASGAVDSINRLIRGGWKPVEIKKGETTVHGVFRK